MTISGRFVVNAISVGNLKLCFKSVSTCQSVQPSSNDGLRIFLPASFEIFPSLTNWIALLLIIFRALLTVSKQIFETAEKSPGLRYVSKYSFLGHTHIQWEYVWSSQFSHMLFMGRMYLTPKHEGWLVLVRRRRLLLWGNLISLVSCAWGLSMWQLCLLHSPT